MRRMINIILTYLEGVILIVAGSFFKGKSYEECVYLLIVCFVFVTSLFINLSFKRFDNVFRDGIGHHHTEVFWGVTAATVIALLISFMPSFTAAVLVILPFTYLITGNKEISLFISLFGGVITAYFSSNSSKLIFIVYLVSIVCQYMLVFDALKKEHLKASLTIVTVLSFLFLISSWYIQNISFNAVNLIIWFAGLMAGNILTLLFFKFKDLTKDASVGGFHTILDDSFKLRKDLQKFSGSIYSHSVKVSKLCKIIAEELGLDELTCEAAGLYYLIGILKDEKISNKGYEIAYENCFPESVCNCIYEYNGINRLPSTKESALVHMVNSAVKKIEVLEADIGKSSWNRQIVISQELNDLSQSGIYDNSGLSMNQFIKIRDILIKEDKIF